MRNLPWAEILVIGLVIGLGAGVFLYAHRDEGNLEESKDRGAELVTALSSYMDDHGTYPDQLDDLVPQYVSGIRQPSWGLGRWRYRRYTPASADASHEVYFQLSVAADESGYPVLYYDFATRRWVLNN